MQPVLNNTSVATVVSGTITQVADASTHSAAPTLDIQQKIAKNAYDVFVCYNAADQAEAMTLGKQLKAPGILSWLDSWRPGKSIIGQQREQIAKVKSATYSHWADPL